MLFRRKSYSASAAIPRSGTILRVNRRSTALPCVAIRQQGPELKKAFKKPVPRQKSPYQHVRTNQLEQLVMEQIVQVKTFGDLQEVLSEHAGEMDRIHIASAFTRAAKLRLDANDSESIVPSIAMLKQLVLKRGRELDSRELSTTLWAAVKLVERMSILSKQQQQQLMLVIDAEWLNFMCERCEELAYSFSSLEISNTLWALGKYAQYSGAAEFFTRVPLASCVFEALCKKLNEHVQQDINDLDTQAISNTLWACVTVGFTDPSLLESAAATMQQACSSFKTQELSNTVWAYSQLRHMNSAMISAVAAHVMQSGVDTPSGQNLSNIALAYATFGGDAAHTMLSALRPAVLFVLESAAKFAPQDQHVYNLLWSYAAVPSAAQPDVIHALMARALQFFSRNEQKLVHGTQIFLAYLTFSHILPDIPPHIVESWQESRRAGAMKISHWRVTVLENQVINALRAVVKTSLPGWSLAAKRTLSQDGYFVVDACLTAPTGARIAFIVFDVKKYTSTQPHVLLGDGQLLLRLLRERFDHVACVSVFEWEALQGDTDRQRAYLLGLLPKRLV